jgi:hypothetical protein
MKNVTEEWCFSNGKMRKKVLLNHGVSTMGKMRKMLLNNGVSAMGKMRKMLLNNGVSTMVKWGKGMERKENKEG